MQQKVPIQRPDATNLYFTRRPAARRTCHSRAPIGTAVRTHRANSEWIMQATGLSRLLARPVVIRSVGVAPSARRGQVQGVRLAIAGHRRRRRPTASPAIKASALPTLIRSPARATGQWVNPIVSASGPMGKLIVPCRVRVGATKPIRQAGS